MHNLPRLFVLFCICLLLLLLFCFCVFVCVVFWGFLLCGVSGGVLGEVGVCLLVFVVVVWRFCLIFCSVLVLILVFFGFFSSIFCLFWGDFVGVIVLLLLLLFLFRGWV